MDSHEIKEVYRNLFNKRCYYRPYNLDMAKDAVTDQIILDIAKCAVTDQIILENAKSITPAPKFLQW